MALLRRKEGIINFTRLIFGTGDKTLAYAYVRNTHTVCASTLEPV